MIKNQLFIAAALFVGVAIGYFVKGDDRGATALPDEDKGYVAASKVGDAGEAASLQALRARIAELEKMLAEKNAEKPVQVAEEKPQTEARDAPAGPRSIAKEMRERMEWMAKERPEEYAQMTNAMARWRQRRIERTHTKIDFLSSIDTSTMTEEQKKNHEAYQDLLVRREELEEKMANQEMTDEDRDDIMRDMHETMHAMRQAAKEEQNTLIDQTVKALGYSGDDAAEVSATFQDILSVTETRGGGPGGPPPGGKP